MNGFIDVLSPIPLKKASQEKTLTPSTDEPSRNALTFAMTSFLTFALSGSMQLLRRYSIARILNLKSSQVGGTFRDVQTNNILSARMKAMQTDTFVVITSVLSNVLPVSGVAVRLPNWGFNSSIKPVAKQLISFGRPGRKVAKTEATRCVFPDSTTKALDEEACAYHRHPHLQNSTQSQYLKELPQIGQHTDCFPNALLLPRSSQPQPHGYSQG